MSAEDKPSIATAPYHNQVQRKPTVNSLICRKSTWAVLYWINSWNWYEWKVYFSIIFHSQAAAAVAILQIGVPPGLEYLAQLNQIFINQEVEAAEG